MKQISIFFVPILAFFLTLSTNLMGQCYFADLPLLQQQSLTALYNATNGDNWINNTNWNNPNVPVDDWYGIQVYSYDCKIAEISLINNNLSGTLPDLDIYTLISINLSNNQLIGNMPDFNATAPGGFETVQIGFIRLNNNQLSGNIPSNLPGTIEYLELSNNQLSGSIPNLTSGTLNYVDLSNNQLSGSIPSNMNISYVNFMDLSNNQLSGSIPYFHSANLQVLHLNNNQLSGNVPNFSKPSLKRLSLENNQFTGAIPEFTNLPNLKHFTACPNNFVGAIPTFQYCPQKVFSSADFVSCVNTATPTPPTVTVSNISNQSATLSWTAVPNVVSYVIKGRAVGDSWQVFNPTTTSRVFDNLQPCTTYQYKVCGKFSNNGSTSFSATGSFTTTGCGNSGKTTDLEMPINLTAQQIGNALQIQFTTDTEETATLQLYNSMGQMVEQMSNIVSIGENEITLPFSGQVTAGVYLLQIHTPTQHRILRVSLF